MAATAPLRGLGGVHKICLCCLEGGIYIGSLKPYTLTVDWYSSPGVFFPMTAYRLVLFPWNYIGRRFAVG